jgi:hypothetical protein
LATPSIPSAFAPHAPISIASSGSNGQLYGFHIGYILQYLVADFPVGILDELSLVLRYPDGGNFNIFLSAVLVEIDV